MIGGNDADLPIKAADDVNESMILAPIGDNGSQ
jgi:hypothetical protein